MSQLLEVIYNDRAKGRKENLSAARKRLIITPVWNDIFIKYNLRNKVNSVFLQAYQYFTPRRSDEDVKRIVSETSQALVDKFYPANSPTASPEEVKDTCSELYGLISYYKEDFTRAQADKQLILAFGTLQSEKAAELIHSWLSLQGLDSRLVHIERAAGREPQFLDKIIVNLPNILMPMIDKYREQGYEIIFNMGSSYPQFLDRLSMFASFFADETIFSSNKRYEPQWRRTLRFPLTIEDATKDRVRKHVGLFRTLQFIDCVLLEDGQEELADLMDIEVDGEGEEDEIRLADPNFLTGLIWYKIRDELYGERIWESAFDIVTYSEEFIESTAKLQAQDLREINQAVDILRICLLSKTTPYQEERLERINLVKTNGRRVKRPQVGQVYQVSMLHGQSDWTCQLTYDGRKIQLEKLNPSQRPQSKSRVAHRA